VRTHLGWKLYQTPEAKALAAWLLDEALRYDHGRGLLEAALSYLGPNPLMGGKTGIRSAAHTLISQVIVFRS
jgi:hypothetical protein